MSHLTYLKTSFKNSFYLEEALNNLELEYVKQSEKIGELIKINEFIIPQSNESDIKFVWNGNEYEFVADFSFWRQAQPVEVFYETLTQAYTMQLIVGEGNKINYESTNLQNSIDQKLTLKMERYNANV